MIFLDNASTTRPLEYVIDAVSESMKYFYGNASSFHKLGIESEEIIRNTKSTILRFINGKSGTVYFTSGGTESNNLSINSINIKEIKNIVSSSIEHASVYNCIKNLSKNEVNVKYFTPQKDNIEDFITEDTDFISIMHVNNETGLILPLEKISKLRKKRCPKAVFHVDAVQSFGKLKIDVDNLGIDLLSASSHKIHGPKGIGFLYASKRVNLKNIMFGGNQQNKIRPGTEPIELINGFQRSIEICNIEQRYNYIKSLNSYLRNKLSSIDGVVINSTDNSSPYILNISVLNLKSEVLLNYLSENGIYISSSSACTGKAKSRVLTEMNFPSNIIDSAIRISFSIFNSTEDIDLLIYHINKAQNILVV